MSSIAAFGALESGLIFALVAFGVFFSFRILNFPDLTVDGSFPMGAAISAVLIVSGMNPWLATLAAFGGGMLAGIVTALMNVKLKILNLLASILTMIALYSINLRIMGKPNVALLGENTVLSPTDDWSIPYYTSTPIVFGVIVLVVFFILLWFLNSQPGLAMRATGANARMAASQGINTDRMIIIGMAVSNGLVAVAGSLFAQSAGSADITMGVGVIVIGLASVIGGEAVMSTKTIMLALLACIVGSILYRFAIALALNADFIGLKAQDLNLVTAVLVAFAIVAPRLKSNIMARIKA
ncbi:ABC transporter permease [Leucothrix arctica]|uniref:ABC transporter permease n=1 Tax=Leucothrix arctica TaxID=1481894 RepID=A0A317CCJ9_9GAMM|nr:ABC transporter permease [Leucothrix arctica]PWQ96278.1 ABC transporter permease [Leucothrix arctica]